VSVVAWERHGLFACKRYNKHDVADSRQCPHVARERALLLLLSHPLLVRLHATAQVGFAVKRRSCCCCCLVALGAVARGGCGKSCKVACPS
jgi:hypothetical protein